MEYLEIRVTNSKIRRAISHAFCLKGNGKIRVEDLKKMTNEILNFDPCKIVSIEKEKLVDIKKGESYAKDDTEYYLIEGGIVYSSKVKCMREQRKII